MLGRSKAHTSVAGSEPHVKTSVHLKIPENRMEKSIWERREEPTETHEKIHTEHGTDRESMGGCTAVQQKVPQEALLSWAFSPSTSALAPRKLLCKCSSLRALTPFTLLQQGLCFTLLDCAGLRHWPLSKQTEETACSSALYLHLQVCTRHGQLGPWPWTSEGIHLDSNLFSHNSSRKYWAPVKSSCS